MAVANASEARRQTVARGELGALAGDGSCRTQCGYLPTLVSSKKHEHVPKMAKPSLSHNEQHLPTGKMLNELVFFGEAGSLPLL